MKVGDLITVTPPQCEPANGEVIRLLHGGGLMIVFDDDVQKREYAFLPERVKPR